MKVKVRYFARFRSLVGTGEEELEVPDGIKVRELIDIIKERHPILKNEVFAEDDDLADVNVSRNGRYVSFDEVLNDGDTIALFPPVSGG
ncbi:molybdopterin converting factor, subunit 1 [Thermococcus onnurineus NA1]|uniref:Molybdopterin converting factor, subunit 1 n=1 Tax=Thermococcus onnurineus (strain NA1) TaxID=523850 RepID=B6YUC8_THEON|nr:MULTISPECIES: ubiquitin-like small modifier protein 1 [Thermococcus]ACJ17113.1 molybdopterin converting factor, subunit 1 [Thermococcus onnurineus NA1]NJE46161.1 MoaD/ThiS family protein [Thermococcus sp. GR7]NJE78203.1 MoaD/ThiS family protein [Thermococcus sp. GR4]NJF22358.1 MoaD/ThiS family protein [Thermococcus sp. GR5]